MNRIFSLLSISVISFVSFAQNTDSLMHNMAINAQRMRQTITLLNAVYLDTVNNDKLIDKALEEMMLTLDPHSNFIAKEDVQRTNEPLEGKFDGIGIEFALINDTLTVQNVIQGGPSMKVGLLNGDKIVKVDNENIAGVNLTTEIVRNKLRGPRGSKVSVNVVRKGISDELEFVITRDEIPLHSVEAAYSTKDNIFYLRLGQFAQNSFVEIIEELEKVDRIPSGIIIDLRGNGGGYMTSALQIAGIFLEKDRLILYSEGLHSPREDFYTPLKGAYLEYPVVVMIDESSASASEIVAGALQDWDRAIVVGRRSFGKGLVQRQVTLVDGSQIRLTTSRYHTPSGRVIQSPYENGKREEYYDNSNARYENGELFHKDSIKLDLTKPFKTLVKERPVYGGGGINPDIFVPLDTTGNSQYYLELVRKGILQDYVNLYLDENRNALLKDSTSFEVFEKHYEPEAAGLFDGLIEYASSNGLENNDAQIAISHDIIALRMKALIADFIFGTTGYYRVVNEVSPDFETAVKAVRDWKKFWKAQ